jgi:hypothetical protein
MAGRQPKPHALRDRDRRVAPSSASARQLPPLPRRESKARGRLPAEETRDLKLAYGSSAAAKLAATKSRAREFGQGLQQISHLAGGEKARPPVGQRERNGISCSLSRRHDKSALLPVQIDVAEHEGHLGIPKSLRNLLWSVEVSICRRERNSQARRLLECRRQNRGPD